VAYFSTGARGGCIFNRRKGVHFQPALTDEILICEGDLIGKTSAQLGSLHFRRDRDWLQS
jgi:hypothetical protein